MLGIGACSKALERLEIEHEIVDAVEIDKYAIESFNAIHGTNFEVQDITKWDKDIEVDLIMGGFPCQDISVAGKQAGIIKGKTRSGLMYEMLRIINKLKPKYVLTENVANLLSYKHKPQFDEYINELNNCGYNCYYQLLNSKDYSIPQNRNRIFIVSIRKDIDKHNFKFPEKEELKLRLKDLLEDEVDEKYYLSDVQIDNIKFANYHVNQRRIQEKDYSDCLAARDYKDPKCVQVGELNIKGQDCIKRVYSDKGVSPTLTDMQGGNRQPKILIKNNTQQGYLEAEDRDGIYTNPSNKRGMVQKGMAQTLTGFQDKGVVIKNKRLQSLIHKTKFQEEKVLNLDSITVNVLEKIFKNLFKEI